MSLFSTIKNSFVRKGWAPRTIKSGVFGGLVMEVDLYSGLQFYLGLYERETYPWIKRLSANIVSAVDVGASQGEFSLFILKRTSAKRVLAFDPNAEHADRFTRNLSLNSLDGDARLKRCARFVGSEINDKRNCSLDSLMGELHEPCFVRIDVDGGEADVLRGATNFLQLCRVRLLMETHSEDLETECLWALNSHGYVTRVVRNAWWRRWIHDTRPIAHNRWLVAAKPSDLKI